MLALCPSDCTTWPDGSRGVYPGGPQDPPGGHPPGPGPGGSGGAPRGPRGCTFWRVFNNSPSRDKTFPLFWDKIWPPRGPPVPPKTPHFYIKTVLENPLFCQNPSIQGVPRGPPGGGPPGPPPAPGAPPGGPPGAPRGPPGTPPGTPPGAPLGPPWETPLGDTPPGGPGACRLEECLKEGGHTPEDEDRQDRSLIGRHDSGATFMSATPSVDRHWVACGGRVRCW